jgi:hypothetical protein
MSPQSRHKSVNRAAILSVAFTALSFFAVEISATRLLYRVPYPTTGELVNL